MLSGISITCFAGSHAVVLLLELTRPPFRSGLRGAIMLGFACAGLVLAAELLLRTQHGGLPSERTAAAGGVQVVGRGDWA